MCSLHSSPDFVCQRYLLLLLLFQHITKGISYTGSPLFQPLRPVDGPGFAVGLLVCCLGDPGSSVSVGLCLQLLVAHLWVYGPGLLHSRRLRLCASQQPLVLCRGFGLQLFQLHTLLLCQLACGPVVPRLAEHILHAGSRSTQGSVGRLEEEAHSHTHSGGVAHPLIGDVFVVYQRPDRLQASFQATEAYGGLRSRGRLRQDLAGEVGTLAPYL